jgi:aminoglycoside 2''-phosphotransferase
MEAGDCLAAVRAGFPALGARHAEPFGEGWSFWTFLVDDRYVFQFPRTGADDRLLCRELRLLPELGPTLPFPIPRFEWKGEWTGRTFAGYRLIPGRALGTGDLDDSALTRDIAGFLSALHTFPVERAAALLGEPLTRDDWIAGRVTLFERALATGRIPSDLRARVADAADHALASGLLDTFPPALVHRDLAPVHLLVEGGRLSGVIDFADATIGDPAIDFAGLLRAGWDVVDRILSGYTGSLDDRFRERIALYHWSAPLHDVLYGIETGDETITRSGIGELRRRLDAVARWTTAGST